MTEQADSRQKKNITERTDVKYGYIQEVGTGIPVPGRGGNTSHTIGGEYRVTDTISVEGEKSASDSRSFTDPSAEARDKVMLKYKKSF